ncbi:MAG: formylglycine-generating enzyme family protein [Deltaproteobacteria bacterium]|nr:formylglycine-generating enzyme family protein [Deltaproteobacteria bacterium]
MTMDGRAYCMRCPDGMVFLPGGTFRMGNIVNGGAEAVVPGAIVVEVEIVTNDVGEEGAEADEVSHWVRLSSFCLDRTEVTVDRYRACEQAGPCASEPRPVTADWPGISALDRTRYARLCNLAWRGGEPSDRTQHPVNCVDWEHARRYCEARGARLPTEAEWEYAARGVARRRFPWGAENPTSTRVNAYDQAAAAADRAEGLSPGPVLVGLTNDHWSATAPVGSFPDGDSAEGVQDLAGNVTEWVQDGYWAYDTAPNPDAPLMDPLPAGGAAPDGWTRVLRGGGSGTQTAT